MRTGNANDRGMDTEGHHIKAGGTAHRVTTFNIVTGNATAQGANTLEVARSVDELSRNPKWYAETGSHQKTISKSDHELQGEGVGPVLP